MRVAMVAPLIEPVPPVLCGGTDRVVSVLTEELVARGHQVTLFASGDSQIHARLVAGYARGLRLAPGVQGYAPYAIAQLGEVYRRGDAFDLIHKHADYYALPTARLSPTPTLTTVHGRLDLPAVRRVYGAFPEQPLVSISYAQRRPLPEASWHATVYNGIDLGRFTFRAAPGEYLLYVAHIHPDKRSHQAIALAQALAMRLVMAATVDPADQTYNEAVIARLIRDCPLVEDVGEVDDATRDALFGSRHAYLFPIDWPEPFGLTMVEAMAAGTPVVARRAGAVPEVVADGVTGFVCDSLDEMIAAVPRVPALGRRACRAHVARHFSARAMADAYEAAHTRLLEGHAACERGPRAGAAAETASETAAGTPSLSTSRSR